MPPVYIVLAALAVSASLPIMLYSVAARSGGSGIFARRADRGEVAIDRYLLQGSAGERVVLPVFRGLYRAARRMTPAGVITGTERRLELAGLPWNAEPLLLLKVGAGALSAAATWLLSENVWLTLLLGVIAYLIPDSIIGALGRERQEKVLAALPAVLDQLTMSVEAGVGFEAALARTARAGEGPLAFELRRTLQEMQLGATRTDALRNLADRNDVLDLRAFVSAVSQSEDYGIPVAQVLRVQAAELRTKRRQRAEERAMRIPVKMVFPLVLCIFPALMIVLLGPASLQIGKALL